MIWRTHFLATDGTVAAPQKLYAALQEAGLEPERLLSSS